MTTHEWIEPTSEDFFRFYLEEKAKEYRSNASRNINRESSIILIKENEPLITGRLQEISKQRAINSKDSVCNEPIPISATKLFNYIKSKPIKMISYPEFFSRYEKIDFNTILKNQEVKIPCSMNKEKFFEDWSIRFWM